MKKRLVVLVAILLSLVALQGSFATENRGEFPCGTWLSVAASGEGYVIIEIATHIVGCTHPVVTVLLDGQVIRPFYLSQTKFVVKGSPGPHTVEMIEYCAFCDCSTCASLDIVIE